MALLLHGQGSPLPDYAPFVGQWLNEGGVFLFDPGSGSANVTGPRLGGAFVLPSGQPCAGIDASGLAVMLGTTTERVMQANKTGELLLLAAIDAAPSPNATWAKIYVFGLNGREGSVKFEFVSEARA